MPALLRGGRLWGTRPRYRLTIPTRLLVLELLSCSRDSISSSACSRAGDSQSGSSTAKRVTHRRTPASFHAAALELHRRAVREPPRGHAGAQRLHLPQLLQRRRRRRSATSTATAFRRSCSRPNRAAAALPERGQVPLPRRHRKRPGVGGKGFVDDRRHARRRERRRTARHLRLPRRQPVGQAARATSSGSTRA